MKSIFSLQIFTLLLSLLMAGCNGQNEKNFLGSGTLEAEEILVSSLLSGRVDSLFVREGSTVLAGQVIACLEWDKLEAQRRQSQAVLEELTANRSLTRNAIEQAREVHANLSANLQRQKSLLQSGSSAQQIVDDLTTQEQTAALKWQAAREQLAALDAKEKQITAALDLINLQIRDATITAPRSGTILEKFVDAGEIVLPNGPLVKIANLQSLWIKIYLDEKNVGLVTLGKTVQVRVDAFPGKNLAGKVTWISPKAEFTPKNVQTRELRADLVYAVKVEFDNPDQAAAIGMPADVYLP